METLKQLLAFPLYATVVWLLWVLGRQAGTDFVALALLFAVAVSLTGWMAGRAQNAGRARGGLVGLVLLVGTIGAGGVVIGSQKASHERIALHSDAVERAFVGANALLLRADWTSRDAEITAVLATFGRSGVPLYVVYPASTSASAELLPAVLTPGIVIDAVTRASGGAKVAASRDR